MISNKIVEKSVTNYPYEYRANFHLLAKYRITIKLGLVSFCGYGPRFLILLINNAYKKKIKTKSKLGIKQINFQEK